MGVNGVTDSTNAVYTAYNNTASKEVKAAEETAAATATNQTSAQDTGVVYESTAKQAEKTTASAKKIANPDLVAKLKADMDARTNQLQNIVSQMLSKQGTTFANANDMWSILASGKFTVDPATKAQAQADIAEDGYWGVKQTSDRIIDFAKALAGDDPDALEKMREAFKKGYKQAEKTWGGKLPDISQQTYDAVMKKFDELAEQNKQKTAETAAAATADPTTTKA